MSTNTELYEQDFYRWCLETCASLGAREFDAIDVHHLIEEIRDLGNHVRSALESDLGIVVLHLLKWQYQPGGRQGHRAEVPERRAGAAGRRRRPVRAAWKP